MQKRNNVFMLSYITFIIFSIILRCFIDYELWGPIVLAVTISSILFAVEDVFRSLSLFLNNLHEIAHAFVNEARRKTTKDLEMLSVLTKKANDYKDCDNRMDQVIEIIEERKKLIDRIIEEINKIELDSKEKFKLQKKYFNVANILAYLGFLTLFCILIIASLVTIPTLIQEIITVMTFAIILFTQYINVLITKKIKENSKKSDDALSKYDEAQKELQNMNRDFYKIIDAINDYEEAKKEYENVCEQLNEIENI